MNDLLIDACRWHIEAETQQYKQRAVDHFRDSYVVLLDFLRNNGLLINPSLGQNTDWTTFEFRQSHLTEEGFTLVKLCHGTWSPSFEQANSQRHLTQWKRQLAKMRLKT